MGLTWHYLGTADTFTSFISTQKEHLNLYYWIRVWNLHVVLVIGSTRRFGKKTTAEEGPIGSCKKFQKA